MESCPGLVCTTYSTSAIDAPVIYVDFGAAAAANLIETLIVKDALIDTTQAEFSFFSRLLLFTWLNLSTWDVCIAPVVLSPSNCYPPLACQVHLQLARFLDSVNQWHALIMLGNLCSVSLCVVNGSNL